MFRIIATLEPGKRGGPWIGIAGPPCGPREAVEPGMYDSGKRKQIRLPWSAARTSGTLLGRGKQ